MTHGVRLPRALPSNFRGGRHKEKFYYRGTCWSPSNGARRLVPLSSDTPSDNVAGLFPGLYQASNPFKWSQCNRTVSTGMSTPLLRRDEEITAGYLLVTTVTNAVVQATILHRHRITFKSRFRVADALSILQINTKTIPPYLRELGSRRRVPLIPAIVLSFTNA